MNLEFLYILLPCVSTDILCILQLKQQKKYSYQTTSKIFNFLANIYMQILSKENIIDTRVSDMSESKQMVKYLGWKSKHALHEKE